MKSKYTLRPASPEEADIFYSAELVDAMERLGLSSEADLYVQAEEYYDYDYIQSFIPDSTTLSQLNELCGILSCMDGMDRVGFRGLLQSSAFYDRFSLGVEKLLDIAQAKDCFHIADGVGDDTQLGRYLCFNGFIDGVDDLPEKVYELLDFQKIGKNFREAEHGAFADGCYVAPDREIPHREMRCGISPPEYIVMMNVVNKADMSKHFPIALPADCSEMDYALSQTSAETWSDALCICTDCQVPQLIDAITQVNNIAIANRFAEMLDRLPVEDVSKLKAVLDATHCTDLTSASLIAGELDNYMLSEDIRDPEDMGRWMLGYMLSDADRDLILKHINLYAYGKEVLEQEPARMSASYSTFSRTCPTCCFPKETRSQRWMSCTCGWGISRRWSTSETASSVSASATPPCCWPLRTLWTSTSRACGR